MSRSFVTPCAVGVAEEAVALHAEDRAGILLLLATLLGQRRRGHVGVAAAAGAVG